MATILNVLANANGPEVVGLDDINEAISAAVKQAQETNAKNDAKRSDAGWRQELEELTRRLSGMPSVDQAEAALASLKSSVAAVVKEYKAKIAQAREAQKEKYLSPQEQTHVTQKIEVLGGELEDFKRQAEMRLNFAQGRLKDAAEWEPKRARWQELKDRAKKIDAALQQV